MQITVGADPEVFIAKNNMFVSAHDKLPGTKQDPYPVQKGAVQVDGMAAEYNIEPASTEEEFLQNLEAVQKQLLEMLPEYSFIEAPSVMFDEDFLKDIPYEALVLGCEPDFNAYSGHTNPRPLGILPMRTAGGHVHIGGFESDNPFESFHYASMCKLIQLMDEEVGIYSILWDMDDRRREMYGKAGAFRPKTYGVEYRSMSNMWTFNKNLQKFVYRNTIKAVLRFLEGEVSHIGSRIRRIIDTSDRHHSFFKNNIQAEEVLDLVASR